MFKILLLSAIATYGLEFSGKVVNKDGSPHPGVTVLLASTRSATLTDDSGSWSLKSVSSVVQNPPIRPVSAHLVPRESHIRLSWKGKDIVGRATLNNSGLYSSSFFVRPAARAASATPDTLVYAVGGKVFLRDTVSESRLEMFRLFDTLANPLINSPGMKLILAGTYAMGSPGTEMGRGGDEMQHTASVSAFCIDTTLVTQGQYLSLMGVNPSVNSSCGLTCPVDNVTWYDAVLYCNARSKRDGLDTIYSYATITGTNGMGVIDLAGLAWRRGLASPGYRLPTETEWEYSTRAGTTTPYYWGIQSDTATLHYYAWSFWNSSKVSHPVARKPPNPFGLYDAVGNVAQWVSDWHGKYPAQPTVDYEGPASGFTRVVRGGGQQGAAELRSAYRSIFEADAKSSNLGFRCVRPSK